MILHERIAFYSTFLNIHRSGVLTALAWLAPVQTAAISARSVYTIQPCTVSLHAKPRKVYACLAVICHLRFWQNERGLLRATAVTRGWNGYRNKNLHRKVTMESEILPPLQQGFEPATFRSRVQRQPLHSVEAERGNCAPNSCTYWNCVRFRSVKQRCVKDLRNETISILFFYFFNWSAL